MEQRRFTSADFVPANESGDPDAHLDPNDPIHELKALSGVGHRPHWQEYTGSNISHTANEKAELMKKHDIKPGTPEWFRLWFSLPYMTGERPV